MKERTVWLRRSCWARMFGRLPRSPSITTPYLCQHQQHWQQRHHHGSDHMTSHHRRAQWQHSLKQACSQLPTSAENVALSAFAAARHAATPCCCGTSHAAIDRYSYPPAHSSKPTTCCCSGQIGWLTHFKTVIICYWLMQYIKVTDGRTLYN